MSGQVSIQRMRTVLPYDGKRTQLASDEEQDTNAIIKYVKKQYERDKTHYDKIAEPIWQGNVRDTADVIFRILKKHVTYIIEPELDQTVKTPGRILADGHGDCKHYALYTVGAVNALERMGYPIHARFRFVADKPNTEVHHVFAVVEEKGRVGAAGKNFWVDPVLQHFDERPTFYNITDANMTQAVGAISMLSGTAQGREVAMVGKKKKKHRNVFREIAHGMQVNAHNINKGIKKVEHGMEVNLHNAEHAVLNVAGGPARNAYLALVDFNMFNLAKRLHETLQGSGAGALMNQWKKLGGNPNKLKSAVNNGIKNYNKHHGHKISGFDYMGWHRYNEQYNRYGQMIFEYPHHMTNEPWNAHHVPAMIRGVKMGCGCGGNGIGCLPACAPALIALASAIMAAMGKFLKSTPGEKQDMASAAKEGVMKLMQSGGQGIDMANGEYGDEAAAALQQITKPSQGGGMEISTGVSPDGEPVMSVHSVDHPAIQQAGDPMTDDDDDTGKSVSKRKQGNPDDENFFQKIWDDAKQAWSDHKGAIIGVSVLVLVVWKGVPAVTGKRKRR